MGIRLSDKHGVNPSVGICFWCGESSEVILFGRMKNDREAPREVCLSYEPCNACKKQHEQGIWVIEAEETPTQDNQPPMGKHYPTSNWWVVAESVVARMINDEQIVKDVLAKRVLMLNRETARLVGFYQNKENK
jgi:hypothetical protein